MHQHLLRKFERESKAMKRLSMNNEELMWKLQSQTDVDDPGDQRAAALTREAAAGGMFMSATLPLRPGRRSGGAAGGAMSRSYESPRAMFGAAAAASSSGARRPTSAPRQARPDTAPAAVRTDPERAPAGAVATSDAARLRRSGTYDVVDDK